MLRDSERETLEKLRDGFELLTGRGLWGIHCELVRGGERYLVHRSVFSRLRNEGYVKYSSGVREKGFAPATRLRAELTKAGLHALEKNTKENSVSDL